MSILETELATYEDVWSSVSAYGDHAPGEHYLPLFLEMVGPVSQYQAPTVLDAGTGSGKGALALKAAGFDVRGCDLTPNGLSSDAVSSGIRFIHGCPLWNDLSIMVRGFGHPSRSKADYVYCTDVLEHIPPQFTMLVVDQMLRVCRRGLFLTISLVPDQFGVWVGKALHQSVFPFTWWKDALGELGDVVEARDLISNAVFLVRPR